MELRLIHVYYEVVVALFSYIFTVLVAYLAIHKTNKTMQQYKIIILMSAIADFLFSTTSLISMPVCF
jgi:fumarate reductase subunit D